MRAPRQGKEPAALSGARLIPRPFCAVPPVILTSPFSAYAKDGGLEPSVAQPPLPLQLFLPLQPLSLDLQPPWPLQSFLPLQECLSSAAKDTFATETFPAEAFACTVVLVCALLRVGVALIRSAVPASKPATAAAVSNEFFLSSI